MGEKIELSDEDFGVYNEGEKQILTGIFPNAGKIDIKLGPKSKTRFTSLVLEEVGSGMTFWCVMMNRQEEFIHLPPRLLRYGKSIKLPDDIYMVRIKKDGKDGHCKIVLE